MTGLPENFYAQWRVRCGVAPLLRDDCDSPPERLLQAIWKHQRLRRDQLFTLDGEPVRVLHPGFHNLEGGPDFRGAVVQRGSDPARSGDIEVDLRSSGWHNHGHDRNPAFKNVILHVVWDCERPLTGAPPLLPLRAALDAPLGELSGWLNGEGSRQFPEHARGLCSPALRQMPKERLDDLLRQAAGVRLRSKAGQFQARARQAGWDQALWEGLFRALGFKHNVWAMQQLAELRPKWSTSGADRLALESRLLGLSGLLPAELSRTQSAADKHLRELWDRWWRDRDLLADSILPRSLWRLHGLRPANHPQRRIALAAAWNETGTLPANLERWCSREPAPGALARSLFEILEVKAADFWSRHWTLRSERQAKPLPFLGAARVTDLAVNVVLPWLWARAAGGGTQAVRERIEKRYFAWPAAEDNSLLRLARERLLGGAKKSCLGTAAAQQGLIQVVRDFCDGSNAVCQECKFPALIKEFEPPRSEPASAR